MDFPARILTLVKNWHFLLNLFSFTFFKYGSIPIWPSEFGKRLLFTYLIKKLWRIFIEMKQKNFFFEKKVLNGQLKKTEFFKIANSQKFFAKILEIGPWIIRIDWCERAVTWFNLYGSKIFLITSLHKKEGS